MIRDGTGFHGQRIALYCFMQGGVASTVKFASPSACGGESSRVSQKACQKSSVGFAGGHCLCKWGGGALVSTQTA